MKLVYNRKVYEDAEDTWLLQKALMAYLAKHKPKSILDVGTGTGILAITAGKAVATDIDFEACKLAKHNAKLNNAGVKVVCCDLVSAIKKKFDLVVFNPPYLPEIEVKTDIDRAVCGGSTGTEVFCRFLSQVKAKTILFVYSSLEDFSKIKKKIESMHLNFEVLREQTFDDGEKLYIGKINK